jgi:hypothetical protein
MSDYNGIPLATGVVKKKTVLKLPSRMPRPAPIGTPDPAPPPPPPSKPKTVLKLKKKPLAPMPFKGGAQKEEIPEREQEGPVAIKAKEAPENKYLNTVWDPTKPVDGYLTMGKKIIRRAIMNIVADITNGDLKASSLLPYLIVNVPLGKLIPKNFIVGKGAWNQGAEVSNAFDSPDVSFMDEDSLIGARIGIHWTEKGAPVDEPGKSWWGCIRLAVTVSKDGKESWQIHARTEYEKADDERIDNFVEKRLKALDKSEGYSGNALEALKEASQEVDRVIQEANKE